VEVRIRELEISASADTELDCVVHRRFPGIAGSNQTIDTGPWKPDTFLDAAKVFNFGFSDTGHSKPRL
jgi:hypothetical protein